MNPFFGKKAANGVQVFHLIAFVLTKSSISSGNFPPTLFVTGVCHLTLAIGVAGSPWPPGGEGIGKPTFPGSVFKTYSETVAEDPSMLVFVTSS